MGFFLELFLAMRLLKELESYWMGCYTIRSKRTTWVCHAMKVYEEEFLAQENFLSRYGDGNVLADSRRSGGHRYFWIPLVDIERIGCNPR